MGTYAKGTTVEVSASQQEIARTLTRYKVETYSFGQSPGQAMVLFQVQLLPVRIAIPLPPRPNQAKILNANTGRYKLAEPVWEQQVREAWRALTLLIKANLEAVERGITTPERAFMAYLVLPGGQTLADAVLPNYHEALRTGDGPLALTVGDDS